MTYQCHRITGLHLDNDSKEAISIINDKVRAGRALSLVLSAGVFAKIFLKSKPPQAAYNISQTDWSLYGRAMAAIPQITKMAIQRKAQFMILHYQVHNNRKLLDFWRGIYHGCR